MTTEARQAHPITVARKAAGLSMEALAAKAHISTATVYRAEASRHATKPDTRQKIAKALGVDAASLIREDHGLTVPATPAGAPHHSTRDGDTSPNATAPGAARKEA